MIEQPIFHITYYRCEETGEHHAEVQRVGSTRAYNVGPCDSMAECHARCSRFFQPANGYPSPYPIGDDKSVSLIEYLEPKSNQHPITTGT
jgi:hypothetical protein